MSWLIMHWYNPAEVAALSKDMGKRFRLRHAPLHCSLSDGQRVVSASGTVYKCVGKTLVRAEANG